MLIYIILGYISGSILYAPIWAKILHTGSITEKSKDKNPGTANAFMYGGVLCGVLTLVCELLKGYIPVRLCIMNNPGCVRDNVLFALVLCAPVIGHIFPILNGFHGGKGIAATFGCLLGLVPMFEPVLIMAATFIFFSVILKISPNIYRTIAAYITALPLMTAFSLKLGVISICIGFTIIAIAVGYKLFKSSEEREKLTLSILWRQIH